MESHGSDHAGEPDWLAPLAEELRGIADFPEKLAARFERLRAELGAAEAGHRWWAVFGASDAAPT